MVDPQENPAECSEVVAYGCKLFVRNMRVDSEGERNVLTVAANISHAGKRFIVESFAESALVCKVVVIGIVPLE